MRASLAFIGSTHLPSSPPFLGWLLGFFFDWTCNLLAFRHLQTASQTINANLSSALGSTNMPMVQWYPSLIPRCSSDVLEGNNPQNAFQTRVEAMASASHLSHATQTVENPQICSGTPPFGDPLRLPLSPALTRAPGRGEATLRQAEAGDPVGAAAAQGQRPANGTATSIWAMCQLP